MSDIIRRSNLHLAALVLFAACSGKNEEAEVDSDGDGLFDSEEAELGLDPNSDDTDGDGLVDGAEAGHGADPLLPDTDEDGYTDRDEVYTGHDPADPEDRIYKGNWPYVFDKSVIPKTAGDFRAIGNTFFRLKLVDHLGEEVDLYDFYNADKPIVLDISAEWCPPCNGMASWIEGGDDSYNYGSIWSNGPAAVRKGDVYWITIMPEDVDNQPATPEVAARWAETYPSKKIPVLADPLYYAPDYAGLSWWPTLILLEPDLSVSEANDPGPNFGDQVTVLEELARRFP